MSFTRNLAELEDSGVEEVLPEAQPLPVLGGGAGHMTRVARRIAHEPLVHFLLAGLLLFVGATVMERRSSGNSREIRVSAAETQRLEDVWSRQYGRTPTPTELQNLIDDYVREEIYYREAVASGLDKDDSIIRRRLVEKMEFLSQEVASGEPTEKELQDYFARNREKFQQPAQIAFSHIYFSPSKHGAALQGDVARSLIQLRDLGDDRYEASKFGDAFMLQSEYPLQTPEEIRSLFGAEFSNAIFKLRPGQWEGPIRSSYGLHVVRVTQYQPERAPQLNDVRAQVATDFKSDRVQAATENYYARLRKRYQVRIDDADVAAATKARTTAGGARQADSPAPDVD
jgi:peptidyl-prolyl cis-trans isomerase C